jgi:lipopolysaccharide/colanic/teichoic acid biosynthesis glycosyltransferase
VTLDIAYVSTWSLALDLKILLRTIPAVLARRGAV